MTWAQTLSTRNVYKSGSFLSEITFLAFQVQPFPLPDWAEKGRLSNRTRSWERIFNSFSTYACRQKLSIRYNMLEEAHLLKYLCPNASLFWLNGTLSTVKPTRQFSHRILLDAEEGKERGKQKKRKERREEENKEDRNREKSYPSYVFNICETPAATKRPSRDMCAGCLEACLSAF